MLENNKETKVIDALPTMQETIQRDLKKYNDLTDGKEIDAAIDELKKEFTKLKINRGIVIEKGKPVPKDKEGYKKVYEAYRVMVSKRNALEKKRQELKADSIIYGKAVDARAKEIALLLTPIEEYLLKEKEQSDKEIADAQKKIDEEKQRQFKKRHDFLTIQCGMNLIGNQYIWSSKMDAANQDFILKESVEKYDDTNFYDFANKMKETHEKDLKIFQEEQERRNEEEKKLADAKKKLEEERNKLLEEDNKAKNERAIFRNKILSDLGLKCISFRDYWLYISDYKFEPIISFDDVLNMDSAVWEDKLKEIKETYEQLVLDDEAQNKIKDEELQQKIQEQKEKEQEAEKSRLEKLNDIQKYNEYIDSLLKVTTVKFNNKEFSERVEKLRGYLLKTKL